MKNQTIYTVAIWLTLLLAGCKGDTAKASDTDSDTDSDMNSGTDSDTDNDTDCGEGDCLADAAPEGQATDCDLVGCAAAPFCGEECQSVCGCCPCETAEEDADGNRCQDGCWLATADDVHCQQPWDGGPCKASIPVYWFNAATNRCEQRTYGGCEGNANRFDRLAFCEQDCARVPGPSDDPLPVVYDFSDPCNGNALTEDGRRIVTEFVAAKPLGPSAGDAPYIQVMLMAGNLLCSRATDIILTDAGVEAFVDYIEYGVMGYLSAHETEIPVDTINADLTDLASTLGVETPQVDWR